jgi:membrane-associated phospholipid phosphatase
VTATPAIDRAAETTAKATEAVARATDTAAKATETAARATDTAARAAHRETLPTWLALSRGRAVTAAGIVGLFGFLGIFAAVRARRSEAIDLALSLKLQRRRSALLDRVMAGASWLGFPPQSRIIPPSAIATMWLLRFREEAVFQALAWGTGFVSTILKDIMRRQRPVAGTDLRVVAAPLGGSSFPSGHVITYVGTYGFFAYLVHTLVRPVTPRRVVVGALAALLALVGPSRIYQGHHWPTDVTASYLLGTSYLVVLTTLYRRAKRAARRSAAPPPQP